MEYVRTGEAIDKADRYADGRMIGPAGWAELVGDARIKAVIPTIVDEVLFRLVTTPRTVPTSVGPNGRDVGLV